MPSQRSRRSVLAACTGLLAAGGCLGTGSDSPATSTTTAERTEPTTTAEQTEAVTPDLGGVWVTDSVVHTAMVDSRMVSGSPDGTQLVFARYVDESRVDPEAFSLVVDGERYAPKPPRDTYADFETIANSTDRVADDETVTGFVVDVRDTVDSATLEYGEAWSHDLSNPQRERLTGDPSFEVREFTLPDTVSPGDSLVADVTVANVGTGPGTFRATVPRATVWPTLLERDVAAGETASFTGRITWGASDGAPLGRLTGEEYELVLSWPDGQRSATITVTEQSTTTDD
ncbi:MULTISPECIES: hypothetical protein [Haloarcula]|uniref:Uncharacterized protein n=1 Tax=Haloarcula pellucida TaxID=1427151 RepID=A0A830GGD7_9EURY|nr:MULTISPECIES: hypothetical protein [Halomicroarcula]MBX0346655.1 hypothetical protein [Halomicroarcula pellucida]MDS0277489.1 hypothetical protein [Halomicroarcula sp. S1AR25-4]GGN84805.1 hypothetical protein GCM10009030_00720 [Halomicroarcula pellucida]